MVIMMMMMMMMMMIFGITEYKKCDIFFIRFIVIMLSWCWIIILIIMCHSYHVHHLHHLHHHNNNHNHNHQQQLLLHSFSIAFFSKLGYEVNCSHWSIICTCLLVKLWLVSVHLYSGWIHFWCQSKFVSASSPFSWLNLCVYILERALQWVSG